MSKDSTYDFKRLHRFLGYGNHHAEVVLIGIEEGSEDYEGDAERSEVEDLHEFLADHGREPERVRSPLWDAEAMVAQALLSALPKVNAARAAEFRVNELGTRGSRTFVSNLFAGRAPSTDDEASATQTRQSSEWLNAHRERHQRLRSLLDDGEPSFIVCFGKTRWPGFRAALGVSDLQEERLSSGRRMQLGKRRGAAGRPGHVSEVRLAAP